MQSGVRTSQEADSKSREPLNKSSSAVSGSFPSTLRHRKWEIHTVFLRFRYLDWTKNLSLTALVDLIRGSQDHYDSDYSGIYFILNFR